MALRPEHLNIISLCTGGGGLDLGVELAIPSARPVLCVEREAFSVANLVSQMQRGVMAPAPVWSDVRTVPGRRFRGGVDGVIGGIPCQPYSLAGKRLGRADERDLWGAARRIFVQSGAWFILIENVGGMLSEGGAERVRGDLLRLGCKVEGGLFRASEVGASHERERLFILGVADGYGEHGHRRGVWRPGWGRQSPDGGLRVANARAARLQGRGSDGRRPGERPASERSGGALADTDLSVLCGQSPTGQQLLLQQDDGVGRGSRPVADADSARPATERRDIGEVGGFPEAERQSEHRPVVPRRDGAEVGDASGGGFVGDVGRRPGQEPADRHESVADTLGRGRDGWSCEPQWSPEERAAVEWASQGPHFAPGPADRDGWTAIAHACPERLPALSSHDVFRVEVGKARAAADGLAPEGSCKAWGGSPPATWLDETGPYGLRPAVVQEIAQFTLRERSDGVAARIDELRMLGNGVVNLEGAYALRTLATDLARRSAGAAELVRLMGEP